MRGWKITIITGLMLLLFISIVYITQKNIEKFDANVCSGITNSSVCDSTADCNWDTGTSTCLSCAEYSLCSSCTETHKCGWCADINKCIMSNRNGLPNGNASNGNTCSDINYILLSDQCPSLTGITRKTAG